MARKSPFTIEFKHEVCQFYDNNTGAATVAKYKISKPTLAVWRKSLGYRNKHLGYNTAMASISATKVNKARNFKVVMKENGELRAELLSSKLALAVLERDYQDLTSRIKKVSELLTE